MPDETRGTRAGLVPDPGVRRPAQVDADTAAQFLDDDAADATARGGGSRRQDTQLLDGRGSIGTGLLDDDADLDTAGTEPDDAPPRTLAADRTADHSGGPPVVRHARDDNDDHGPGFLTRMIAIALAVLLGVAGAVIALSWLLGRAAGGLNPFDETTVDRSGRPVLQSLTDLQTYHAASGYYEIVVDQETDVENLPAFLAGERVIFVAAGSVDATVDFSGLGQGAVTTDTGRTAVTVALPAVQLSRPQLDLDRSYVADHRRGLRERLQDAAGAQGGGQNTEALYRLAEQRLADAGARTDDLRQRARDNTRAMLKALLTEVGYTSVTVTFADE